MLPACKGVNEWQITWRSLAHTHFLTSITKMEIKRIHKNTRVWSMWEKKDTREGSWSGLAKPAFKYKLPESTTAASIGICSFLPWLAKQQNENHNDPLLALHIQKQKSHHRRQSATRKWWSAESTNSRKCDQWSFDRDLVYLLANLRSRASPCHWSLDAR